MKKFLTVFIVCIVALSCVFVWGCGEKGKEEEEVAFVLAKDSPDGYAYITKPEERDLVILQLTDIHIEYFLGGEESVWTDNGVCGNIQSTLEMIDGLIASVRPDLVIITGDTTRSWLKDNLEPYQRLAAIFENRGVLWMPLYGNHDYESGFLSQLTTAELTEELQKYPHCLIYNGGCGDGVSNYFVNVKDRDGTILYTLGALDCVLGSRYDGGYSYIKTEAQVAWYEQNIRAISALRYGNDSGEVVKSMLFMHTPVPEVVTAWDSVWNNGEPNENYFYGELLSGRSTFNRYLGEDTLFQKAVELGSTEAMFFGHYHDNGFSVEYEGIRLTAGQMTTNNMDYRIGSELNGLLFTSFDFRRILTYGDDRGGTKITLSSPSGFSVSPVYAREVFGDYSTRYLPDYEAVYASLEARGIGAVR